MVLVIFKEDDYLFDNVSCIYKSKEEDEHVFFKAQIEKRNDPEFIREASDIWTGVNFLMDHLVNIAIEFDNKDVDKGMKEELIKGFKKRIDHLTTGEKFYNKK